MIRRSHSRQIGEKGVGLVGMGTQQGPSFLDKLFGSNTEQLLRQAPCPSRKLQPRPRLMPLQSQL
ncbi:adenine nucleotide alpha hydrolase family protein [Pontibacter beigongshangensis]|uniref:hypothetical protein n=1 Tax=Pontibacter beigongshangensis TaxID=2574733 RepID=UPI001650C4CA|nr:hypothetical protein [Pontibacter beigongshangensis]